MQVSEGVNDIIIFPSNRRFSEGANHLSEGVHVAPPLVDAARPLHTLEDDSVLHNATTSSPLQEVDVATDDAATTSPLQEDDAVATDASTPSMTTQTLARHG